MPHGTQELLEMRKKHIPQGPFNTTQSFVREARGAIMIDVEGRELIDFAGGIGVNNVGHCHPKVVAAIKDQAEKCIHTCFHVAMYESYIELAAPAKCSPSSIGAWRRISSPWRKVLPAACPCPLSSAAPR